MIASELSQKEIILFLQKKYEEYNLSRSHSNRETKVWKNIVGFLD